MMGSIIIAMVAMILMTSMLVLTFGRLESPGASTPKTNSVTDSADLPSAVLADADRFMSMLSGQQGVTRNTAVRDELGQLIDVMTTMTAYVKSHPEESVLLESFLASYAEQVGKILSSYRVIETYGVPKDVDVAGMNVIKALNALEGAGRGGVRKATAAQSAVIDASSEAINRLVAMQGYSPDATESGDAMASAARLKSLVG